MISNLCLMVRIQTEYITVYLETQKILTTACYLMGNISKTRKSLRLTRITLKHYITILEPNWLSQVKII